MKHRREILRGLILSVAVLAAPASADAAEGPGRSASLSQLLVGAEVQVVDANRGGVLSRAILRRVSMRNRCDLVLTGAGNAVPITIRLRDLRFVQGDDDAMLDVATRSEPQREWIIAVGRTRYAAAMDRLTSLARRCGARLVGPPPIMTTARR